MMTSVKDEEKYGDLLKGVVELREEITEGLINYTYKNRNDIQHEVERLRDKTLYSAAPEAALCTELFRQYADAANHVRDSKASRAKAIEEEIPEIGFKDDDLAGLKAFTTQIFWIRFCACIFSLISFILMSLTPYIVDSKFYPTHLFFTQCRYSSVAGSFNYIPYQMVLALGVIIYAHNSLLCMYYVLPVNENKQKFIPGLMRCLQSCHDTDLVSSFVVSCFACIKTTWKFLQLFFDTILLLGSLGTAVTAAIFIDSDEKFDGMMQQGPAWTYYVGYFTLKTFYSTFSHTFPVCVSENSDPTPKMRASIAMLFLCVVCQALCFVVSLQAFRKELRRKPWNLVEGVALNRMHNGKGGSGKEFTIEGDDGEEEVVEYHAIDTSHHSTEEEEEAKYRIQDDAVHDSVQV